MTPENVVFLQLGEVMASQECKENLSQWGIVLNRAACWASACVMWLGAKKRDHVLLQPHHDCIDILCLC